MRRGAAAARRFARVPPDDLRARVDAAHLPGPVDAGVVMGAKLVIALGLAGTVVIADSLGSLPAAPLLMVVAPVAGFLFPDLVLGRRARRIASRIRAEVPELADRLHLAVSAGLAPLRAAAVAAAPGQGPLSRELAIAAACARSGVPFDAALDRFMRRCPSADARAMAAALLRSQHQGSDIAPVLLAIAEASRREASLRLRDRAQRAAPKIQLAVALLLVPAAMALIAAALVSGLFGG